MTAAQKFLSAKRNLSRTHADTKVLFSRHRGITLTPNRRSPYESLVRAITHQQLTGKAAQTILGRLIAHFPKQEFPSPEQILKLSTEQLRACGFSRSKTRSIQEIAQAAHSGDLPDRRTIQKWTNTEIITQLTRIYGVGQWTVEMLLIFQLGRLDVWPVDDYGVRKGFQIWKKLETMPTARELKTLGERFRPHASVVALYLWAEADAAKLKKPTSATAS